MAASGVPFQTVASAHCRGAAASERGRAGPGRPQSANLSTDRELCFSRRLHDAGRWALSLTVGPDEVR